MGRRRSSKVKKANPTWDLIFRMNNEKFFTAPEENQHFFPSVVESKLLQGFNTFEIEVGPGSGKFLLQVSETNPKTLYLGIEYAEKFIKVCRDEVREKNLNNVLLLNADAKLFFQKSLPDACIEVVHVYFPDPWPKKSQNKRRFLSPSGLQDVARVLKPKGFLYFATDFPTYAEAVSEDAKACADLKLVSAKTIANGEDAYTPAGFKTHFGERYAKMGKPIFSRIYQRK